MTQRVRSRRPVFNDHPFTGDGASLYAGQTATLQYRNLRVIGAGRHRRKSGWIKGAGGNHDIANSVTKTARRASAAAPTESINWALPAGWLPGAGLTTRIYYDVRRYKDDVENESFNYRVASDEIDENGDTVQEILATSVLLDQVQRSGGIVRIRLRIIESRDGVQPTRLRGLRTAGPSSPADALTGYQPGQEFVNLDTPALLDTSAYTYTIRAENSDGSVTKDLHTGVSVSADASGPPVPTNGSTLDY